ncbi:MAG: AAA family ATPase [Paracoccaceae bacterium]
MTKPVPQAELLPATPVPPGAPLPHIDVHCYASDPRTRDAYERLASDRLMRRATVEILSGDPAAATARYVATTTPHLIVVECPGETEATLAALDALAGVSDPGTRVVVIGDRNDIGLYRQLIGRGVSDYLLAPVEVPDLLASVARIFCDEDAPEIGKVHAFLGASGGAGSSTVAQNVAWTLAERHGQDVLLIDMDLQFGTAALGCDIEHQGGADEAIRDVDRMDSALLERLMVSRGKRLHMLTASADPGGAIVPDAAAIDRLIDVARRNVPMIVLDLPHVWTDWIKATLTRADGLVLTACPRLWSLRSAAGLCDAIRGIRPNDPPPLLALNNAGACRRTEIAAAEIKASLMIAPVCTIAHNAKLFGQAESKGRPVSELAGATAITDAYAKLAAKLAGQEAQAKRGLFSWARR